MQPVATYAPLCSPALKARDYKGPSSDGDGDGAPLITHALRGEGFDASEDGTGRGTPLVPVIAGTMKACANSGGWTNSANSGGWTNSADHAAAGYMIPVCFDTTQITSPATQPGDPAHPLAAGAHAPAIAFSADIAPTLGKESYSPMKSSSGGQIDFCIATASPVAFEPGSIARHAGPAGESPLCPTLRKDAGDNQPAVRCGMSVRRLTPRECERLQGFPDDHTRIPWRKKPAEECPDGPRYKAIGNSMAIPVVNWLGKRIQLADRGLL